MEKIEIVSSFMKNIVWGLMVEGVLVMLFGILIFIYPDLLGMLVGTLMVLVGIVCFVVAYKVNKYSKIKINL